MKIYVLLLSSFGFFLLGVFATGCRHDMVITKKPFNSQRIHSIAFGESLLCFPFCLPLCHSLQGIWAHTTDVAQFFCRVNSVSVSRIKAGTYNRTNLPLARIAGCSVFGRFLLTSKTQLFLPFYVQSGHFWSHIFSYCEFFL